MRELPLDVGGAVAQMSAGMGVDLNLTGTDNLEAETWFFAPISEIPGEYGGENRGRAQFKSVRVGLYGVPYRRRQPPDASTEPLLPRRPSRSSQLRPGGWA